MDEPHITFKGDSIVAPSGGGYWEVFGDKKRIGYVIRFGEGWAFRPRGEKAFKCRFFKTRGLAVEALVLYLQEKGKL